MPTRDKGPTCEECGAQPQELEEVKSGKGVDLGQFQKYECGSCGNEFTALRRYFYNNQGEQVRSPGDNG